LLQCFIVSPIALNIDDRSTWKIVGTELSLPVIFITAGYHKIRTIVETASVKEKLVVVHENISGAILVFKKDVVEINTPLQCGLAFGQGGNVQVDVTIDINGKQLKQLRTTGGKLSTGIRVSVETILIKSGRGCL